MQVNATFEPRSRAPSCTVCPTSIGCPAAPSVPTAKGASAFQSVEATVSLPHPGKILYAAETPAFAVYVVRAGCLKTVTHDLDGNEHVRKFHFPGDVIGLDALGVKTYPSSAVSVTASQVCRISKGQLQQMFQADPEQLQLMLEFTSQNLREALALAGNYTADQRVAAFVLEMEGRLAPAAGEEFELPMTRRDMANHLRLATETVCRVLGRFVDHGWMQGGSVFRVVQSAALMDLARPAAVRRSADRLAA